VWVPPDHSYIHYALAGTDYRVTAQRAREVLGSIAYATSVDTVFGHVSGKINEAWIGRWKSGDWSTRKLSMAYNTDDKPT